MSAKPGLVSFIGRFLGVAVAVILVLWVIGRAFAASKPAGYLALSALAVFLGWSAQHWLKWLPGLLIFGVLNSAISLVSHRAPTNPSVIVSPELALLLAVFYSVGTIVSYRYGSDRLFVLDRVAFVWYLVAMIWPAFLPDAYSGKITPSIAWFTSTGVLGVVIAFIFHQAGGPHKNP